MSKLSLKITLAGRTYPLTVNEGEDEKILKAADDINRAIKLLQENYLCKDTFANHLVIKLKAIFIYLLKMLSLNSTKIFAVLFLFQPSL